jgi:CheY-like chemotaxis protein
MDQHTILFVDDERNVLKTLRRLFRKEPYRTLFAESGDEALKLIEEGEHPTVIVSDQRMPGMSGSDFLAATRERLPDSIRIMLTGFSDIDAAVEAINKSGVYRYILKPWNDEDLKLTVRDEIGRYELIQLNRELTAEVKEKNQVLEELNASLEQKVEERTRELKDALDTNLALTEQLKQKVKELEGRDRILQHLLTIHPLQETLKVVLDVISDVVGVAYAAIHLPKDAEEGVLAAAVSTREGGERVFTEGLEEATRAPAPAGILESAVAKGEPVRGERPAGGPAGRTTDIVPFVAVPIVKGEERLGVIELDRGPGGAPLEESEVRTVSSFAMQAAVAISDSQLKQDLPAWKDTLDDVLRDFGEG